jgi:hypothetical protein
MTTATRKRGLPFKRLSKAAKEKAIEWMRDCIREDNIELQDTFDDVLTEAGFPGMDIMWSLGYCQGDGVAFKGTLDMDELAKHDEYIVEQLARGVLLGINPDDWEWSGKITCDSHYCHWNSMDVELEWALMWEEETEHAKSLTEICRAIRDHIAERCKELSREMEKLGYEEIEYQTSDEHCAECIECNDYRFDREGDLL